MKKQLLNILQAFAWVLLASVAALIVLGLVSCAPVRVASSSDSHVETTQRNDVQTQVAIRDYLSEYLRVMSTQLEFRDISMRRTEYDTSLPVDSVTGLHPVLSETIITDNSRIEGSSDAVSGSVAAGSKDSVSVDKSRTDVVEDVSVESLDKRGIGAFWWWCLAIAAVAVVVGVGWVWRKFRKI